MTSTHPRYIFLNGEMVPFEEAKIHVLTPALKYGATVFEGIRAYWNDEKKELYVFRLNEHSKRLLDSIKIMRMEVSFELDDLNRPVVELLQANSLQEDVLIRHMVFLDGQGSLLATEPVGMAIVATPLARGSFLPEQGVHCCVSSWIRIADTSMPPRVKCAANYHNGRLALLEAQLNDYDAVIMLDDRGKVTEEPRACLFIVREGKLISPLVTSSILESITRQTVMQLAREVEGLEVIERDIDRTELYVADEAFLCGSGAEVTPVLSVDRHLIGRGQIGSITKKLRRTYLDLVVGHIDLYPEWRTAVYDS